MTVETLQIPENHSAAKTLATNLASLLTQHRLSESDLAKALNVPYNTIHRLIEGTTTDPRMSTLMMIAEHFDITIDTLLSNTNQSFASKDAPKLVPIFTWEALQDSDFRQNIRLEDWPTWAPVATSKTLTLGPACYGLESRPSMFPRFPLGTTFIIDPDEQAIDGDLVLIRIKSSGETTLRDLIIDAPHWRLAPTVTGSDILVFDESQYAIIGIVVLTMFYARNV